MSADTDGSERAAQARAWAAARLDDPGVRLEPLAADASARRYYRARVSDGTTRVLMDAPDQRPALQSFLDVERLLREAEVHAPRPHAVDLEAGFLLLSDLGDCTYLSALSEGEPEAAQPLLEAAVEALVRWQSRSRRGQLPPFGPDEIRRELALFTDWYLPCCCGVPAETGRTRLRPAIDALVEQLSLQPRVFVHRDYMPRNLMVCRPKPGVLDFQDAVEGPVTYDLISLIRDAFVSWPPWLEQAVAHRYWAQAQRAGVPVPDAFEAFWRACQWTGVQRHLKVLGIFARLRFRDGKPAYLADAPRFWTYLQRAVADEPALAEVVAPIQELAGTPSSPQAEEDAPCGR